MLLALETSCDETALALFNAPAFLAGERDLGRLLLAERVSSQIDLHAEYGGVVPELAAREHLGNLPVLVEELFSSSGVSREEVTAVAVTRGPGLKGCLLVGLSYAKAFAWSSGAPLLALSHLEGHLFAAELQETVTPVSYPSLALLVSGGHTELVLIKAFREYEVIARTRDDAVGEAFDKCAALLGLPYPGGPGLSRLAALGDSARFRFPLGLREDEAGFSFSGIKTAVYRETQKYKESGLSEQLRADFSASIETALVEALITKAAVAVARYQPKSLVLTGGVAANENLRLRMREIAGARKIPLLVPKQKWCTDNAAMIGMLGLRILENEQSSYLEWRTKLAATRGLGPSAAFDVGAVARWPLELQTPV